MFKKINRNMQEELITFYTAKLAKEKKFNIALSYCYDKTGKIQIFTACNNKLDSGCSAPTQSLLQKWLREVHKLSINVISKSEKLHFCIIVDYKNKKAIDVKGNKDYSFKSYEKALEIGLQEALKLI